jgi:hypothetical protein
MTPMTQGDSRSTVGAPPGNNRSTVDNGGGSKTAPALRQQCSPEPNPQLGRARSSMADVLFAASPTVTAPVERHWFVPDVTGFYCLACALPKANRRHVPKAA